MRSPLILAVGLVGLCVFGTICPVLADGCRADLNACIAASHNHPHICDPLVHNMPTCEANERKGVQQASVNPRYTKAVIVKLYNIK